MECRVWDTGQVRQDRKDAEQVKCRTGVIQDRFHLGQASYWIGVMQERTGSG